MLRTLVLLTLVVPVLPAWAPAPTDNVLILVADDMGVDSTPAYLEGQDLPITPQLDALAAQGVLFRNAYSNPICSPTRASLLTGRYSFRTGIGDVVFADDTYALQLSEVTLPEMLDLGTAGAWDHAAFGKWHVSTNFEYGLTSPNDHGWAHFAGTMMNPDSEGGDYWSWPKVVNGVESTSAVYATTDTVNEALAWISTASEPWVAYVAFNAPHTPLHEPPSDLFTLDMTNGGSPFSPGRGLYKAMVEAMDTEIGRLLSDMDPVVRSRTNVIFLGDNGTPGPWTVPPFPANHAKGNIYEGGTNVPLIVSGPLVDAAATGGQESAGLVHVVDVFATVADIAGVDLGATLPRVTIDGLSLLPYLQDPDTSTQRAHLFTEIFCPNFPNAEPPPFLCQKDLGFGGPGNATLSVCGEVLMEDNTATLLLDNTAPGSLAYLVASLTVDMPFAWNGGIIAPTPIVSLSPLYTNGAGQLSFTVPAAVVTPPITVYAQFAVEDASQTFGWEISNAVAIAFQPAVSMGRTMRNDRYKLLKYTDPFDSLNLKFEMYDLPNDPFEQNDLLQNGVGGLTPDEAAAFMELRDALGALVGP